MANHSADAEFQRLEQDRTGAADWRLWGPYLAERQWGTVREDYSATGDAWGYFPFDHAHLRAYRWGEDGLGGFSDREQRLCLAVALWNGRDPILKERLFGLSNPQGNHGEDVKEYYFYLDATPTHSYLKMLYKYPQRAFPYRALIEENARRTRRDPEYELLDTGIFDDDRYFDVCIEYAKAAPDDILWRITAVNRGPEPAELWLLPLVWFRNTWSWGRDRRRPLLQLERENTAGVVLAAAHPELGQHWVVAAGPQTTLFTENETNFQKLFGTPNTGPYTRDAFHRWLIGGELAAVNPARTGTRAAFVYHLLLEPGRPASVCLRLCNRPPDGCQVGADFDAIFAARQAEAEAFYAQRLPTPCGEDGRRVQRQAFAGLLWSEQYYHYVVRIWLEGDPAFPPPPPARRTGRNSRWRHLHNSDVLLMPDKWEYPWYAAWDLAFHCVAIAPIDPELAKQQLVLLLREWYMHPSGQLPAHEWNFDDVNPPVHAWAVWRVYKIARRVSRRADLAFLERAFHKLLLNFTWWVNRKDPEGRNLFEGGVLGLDNLGLFDRALPLPGGGRLEQSDSTSWVAMFCLNMLSIALELARHDAVYEDIAIKFLEHFIYIACAINGTDSAEPGLWDPDDGFYYHHLHLPDGRRQRLPVRAITGLLPLVAADTLPAELFGHLPEFARRVRWFFAHHPEACEQTFTEQVTPAGVRYLLALVNRARLERLLVRLLDPDEFLSPYGIRSLSRCHAAQPVVLELDGQRYSIDYEPGESTSAMFGGNSNWRGPVWFPLNFLLIEALQRYHYFFGPAVTAELPTGSGLRASLDQIATELSRRLIRLFLRDPATGRRPLYGDRAKFQSDPHWRDLILFYEYFHGETGAGLGASHQTGWTALVAKLIEQSGAGMC